MRKTDLSQCLWKYFETKLRVTPAKAPSIADASGTNSPRLSEATMTNVYMKGANKLRPFGSRVQRSVLYLVDVAGDKPIGAFVMIDLSDLREHLQSCGTKIDRSQRIGFGGLVRQIWRS